MPGKFKKGYFVRGQFVAEGSELDLELKRELKGSDQPSRTDLKRESTELQKIGQELLALRPEALSALHLPEKLADAIEAARRITNFEGRRRQMQFIGKLMRQLEPEPLAAIRTALDQQHGSSAGQTAVLHLSETWRDRLIAQDEAFALWIGQHPATDAQQLRSLIRQARKDVVPVTPGEAARHGRAYREIFALLRAQLAPADSLSEQSTP